MKFSILKSLEMVKFYWIQTISIFWGQICTKFTQNMYFQPKTEKVNIAMKFNKLKLV